MVIYILLVASIAINIFLIVYTIKRVYILGRLNLYLEKVLAGDFVPEILDQCEGEVSILKANIYKTTTTLKYQKELFDLINEWRKQPGHAVLSVVHDLSLGRMYASHALVLKDGKQLVFGNAEEALSPRILNKAWDMDVPAWFRALLAPWQKDS